MTEAAGGDVGATSGRRVRRQFLLMAGVFSLVLIAGHVVLAVTVLRDFARLYADLGGGLPFTTRLLLDASRSGVLPFALTAVDAAVFGAMYLVARRGRDELIFVPLAFYLMVPTALLVWVYQPMFRIINLIQ